MTTCRNCGLEIVFTDRAFYNDEEGYFASGWVDVEDRYFVCPSGLSHDPSKSEDEDNVFPEWDAAAELADDARRGK